LDHPDKCDEIYIEPTTMKVYRDFGDRSDEPHLGKITDEVEMSQDIGARDREGTLIYEGDVVRMLRQHFLVERGKYGAFVYRRVSLIDGRKGKWRRFDAKSLRRMTVVGNIWMNPELLVEDRT